MDVMKDHLQNRKLECINKGLFYKGETILDFLKEYNWNNAYIYYYYIDCGWFTFFKNDKYSNLALTFPAVMIKETNEWFLLGLVWGVTYRLVEEEPKVLLDESLFTYSGFKADNQDMKTIIDLIESSTQYNATIH